MWTVVLQIYMNWLNRHLSRSRIVDVCEALVDSRFPTQPAKKVIKLSNSTTCISWSNVWSCLLLFARDVIILLFWSSFWLSQLTSNFFTFDKSVEKKIFITGSKKKRWTMQINTSCLADYISPKLLFMNIPFHDFLLMDNKQKPFSSASSSETPSSWYWLSSFSTTSY